jgi:cell division septation protein DedD
MPKNSVTDPITDQEIAFAHLLLSGTMNDRDAAEAAGLNPTTAAYTKAKQRVREYIDQHRAAVSEKLVDEEVEGLRRLNIGRDQILARLWELANLPPETTRGSIAGQIKAMSMIVAIEGLIPDRRASAAAKPAAPIVQPDIYVSEAMRWRTAASSQVDTTPPESATTAEATPTSDPPANHDADPVDPFPKELGWGPNAIGPNLDDTTSSPPRLSLGLLMERFPRGR